MIQSGVTVIKQPPSLSPELADRGIDLSLKGMNIQKIIIGIVTGIDILFRLSHNSSYRSDITQDKKQKGEVEVNRRAESVQCAVCSVQCAVRVWLQPRCFGHWATRHECFF